MTRVQGWIIIALLAFLCVHVLAADLVGLKFLSEVSSSSTETPTSGQTPECDPEGDVCP